MDPKPKVFVSLGGSGSLRAFPALLKALSKLPVTVIVATSGRPLPGLGRAVENPDPPPAVDIDQMLREIEQGYQS